MDILVISLAALCASALTLLSGFGLGTLLMPVVAVFFPVEIAVAITAMVHFSNNIFKVVLVGRYADFAVLLRFGITAIPFAILGAIVLSWLASFPPLFSYILFDHQFQIFPIKLLVGTLIIAFLFLELSKRLSGLEIDKKYLPVGGVISGFFGGLSGHQGAFRSMFLLKAGLSKEQFVATGVMIAIIVDMSRMSVYGWDMLAKGDAVRWDLVGIASLSAFLGAFISSRLLKKMTFKSVQAVVSVLLVIVSLGLISGVV